MPDLVTLNTYSSRIEAELVKGLLKSNGINSIIMADNEGATALYPMSNAYAVQVKVSGADLGKAREILEDQEVKK